MWQKSFGTIIGFGLLLTFLGGGYYLLVMPLVSTPARPTFDNEFPVTGPTPKPTPAASSPSPSATPDTSPSSPVKTAKVIEPQGLRVRAEPNRESETLSGVAVNETVEVLETSGNGEFYRIKTADGIEGWVIAPGLELETPAEPNSTNSDPQPQ